MIEHVLQDHLNRYPSMQIQDLYKLLHQAALGSEHAVSDRAAVEHWLMRELAELGVGMAEPLVDPISHNGQIARLHLRPYIAAGHDPRSLLEAFIRTANQYRGETGYLEEYWRDAMALAPFPAREMDDFFRDLKDRNFPAVHHSAEYERQYRPAYRVVSLSLCPQMQL